ncbi:hypothetical protein [Streptococcus ictaluri]|uniref:Uncharacterized protein n=1 Tax=Streptococcus ictaluri 707-05 TaxID=764299 RepID=G5K415_9STRE|nr:hypothetical protein [Streptococcus ictaluri]EHI69878.1 hypothetical protein STRIC_1539 [Streptococcus ictaluri 707-05]
MLNRKFFTYASLLALVAVPAVLEDASNQNQSQVVYAAEVTNSAPELVTDSSSIPTTVVDTEKLWNL